MSTIAPNDGSGRINWSSSKDNQQPGDAKIKGDSKNKNIGITANTSSGAASAGTSSKPWIAFFDPVLEFFSQLTTMGDKRARLNGNVKTIAEKLEIAEQRKNIVGKSKNAENLREAPPKLSRQASAHQLQRGTEHIRRGTSDIKQAAMDQIHGTSEIVNRSGEMWDCIERKPDTFGGYIYEFRLKPEYNTTSKDTLNFEELIQKGKRVDEKESAIFPAVEPVEAILNSRGMILLDPKFDREKWIGKKLALMDSARESMPKGNMSDENYASQRSELEKFLRQQVDSLADGDEKKWVVNAFLQLGYKVAYKPDGIHISLPDVTALKARWKKLREEYPELKLPVLDIKSSDGIAGDMEFIEAYLTHDVLLSGYDKSSAKEFMHDHFAHVYPTLKMLLTSGQYGHPAYDREKVDIIKKCIGEAYRQIINAKEMIVNKSSKISDEKLKEINEQVEICEAVLAGFTDLIFSVESLDAPDFKEFKASNPKLNDYLQMLFADVGWVKYFKNRFPGKKVDSQVFNELMRRTQEITVP